MRRIGLLGLLLCGPVAAQSQPGQSPAVRAFIARERQLAAYYARQSGVPPELVHAIIDVESGWKPHATSAKGAAGLMQLMPQTAYRWGAINRYEPRQNLAAGVAHLAALLGRFGGDLRLTLAAYYAGEKPIDQKGLRYANADVLRYVRAVQLRYQRLKTLCDNHRK